MISMSSLWITEVNQQHYVLQTYKYVIAVCSKHPTLNLQLHVLPVQSIRSYLILGFGDSSGIPTSEEGVATDVVQLYKWAKEKAGDNSKVYVWGHSLGTG